MLAEVSPASLFNSPLVRSADYPKAAIGHPQLDSRKLTDLIKVLISRR